jgi:hypothetical protein
LYVRSPTAVNARSGERRTDPRLAVRASMRRDYGKRSVAFFPTARKGFVAVAQRFSLAARKAAVTVIWPAPGTAARSLTLFFP